MANAPGLLLFNGHDLSEVAVLISSALWRRVYMGDCPMSQAELTDAATQIAGGLFGAVDPRAIPPSVSGLAAHLGVDFSAPFPRHWSVVWDSNPGHFLLFDADTGDRFGCSPAASSPPPRKVVAS